MMLPTNIISVHASYPTDTSQELCYSLIYPGNAGLDSILESAPCNYIPPTTTYGQDGHYTQGSKPSYKDNLNGSVTDENTGLIWQQTPECIQRNWQDSLDYCSELELDDDSDWRLPSRHELTTILEFSQWRPVLNTDYFDHCIPASAAFSFSWTSTINSDGSSTAYVIEFQHGGPLGSADSLHFKSQEHNHRCVRGDSPDIISQFVDNQQDGTVTDINTELMWQKGSQPTTTPWDGNLQYCYNLELAGHTDWRLPNIRELETLVDDSLIGHKISPIFSSHSERPSSTTIAIDPERNLLATIFSLSFGSGGIIDSSKRNGLSARCVRGGPSSEYWSTSEIIEGSNLTDLHFVTPDIGWVVGNEEQVFKTNDGGNTWAKIRGFGSHNFEKVHFTDSNNGWVISNFYALNGRGYLFHTTDGGLCWSEQKDESTEYYKDIFFINENIGWVISSNSIYKTEDAGITWIDQSIELTGSFKNLFFLNETTGWIAGDVIIKTEDGGTTWAQQYTGIDSTLLSVFFSDNIHGWAVGSKGLILNTENGGGTWSSQKYADDNLLKFISFSDSNNGFVFGSYGLFLYTTDGGISWQRKYGASPPLFINSLQMVQGQTSYALADGHVLLKMKPNIIPLNQGDINNDGDVNLQDLILGLKIISGSDIFATIEADIDSDEQIGIEEAIYILRNIAEQ